MRASRDRRLDLAAMLALAAVAFALRWHDLDARTFSHPENFSAGIPMPRWVGVSARRVDWASLVEGTLQDGHPPLYFAAQLVWAKLFGHGLIALRLPSALLGAASVALAYALGRRVAGRTAAGLGALLLATSGLHVYWSQMARMYVPASFLVLLSTWLLLELERRRGTALAIGYGAVTAASLWTQLYAWPAIFVHCLWVAWHGARRRLLPAAAPPLAVALVVSMPVVALTIFQYPPIWRSGQLAGGGGFRQAPSSFFSLGHAFSQSVPFWTPAPEPPLPSWVIRAFTLGLVGLALVRRHAAPESAVAPPRGLAPRPGAAAFTTLAVATAASAWAIADFARWAPIRDEIRALILATAALPLLLGLLGAWLLLRWRRRLALAPPEPPPVARGLDLIVALAVLPLGLMVVASSYRGLLVERGTVVFLPYLLLAAAAGAMAVGGRRLWRGVAAAALLALSLASYRHYARAASSPRDYAGLARELALRLRPDDRVLLAGGYRDPPLLYYFEDRWHQFIGQLRPRRLIRHAPPRLWVVDWGEEQEPPARLQPVLWHYRPGGEVVRAHAATATLWVRAAREPTPAESVSPPPRAGSTRAPAATPNRTPESASALPP